MQDNILNRENICLKTEHFLIFTDKVQKKVAEHFSELLERNYFKIHEDFRFPLDTPKIVEKKEVCGEEPLEAKLCCHLCGSVPEYLRQTGKRAEDYEPWMVGYADSRLGKICLLLPEEGDIRDQAGDAESGGRSEKRQKLIELERIAVHELVHIIFDRHCGVTNGEAWLIEGIAILYAGQTDLRYVSETNCPKIRALGGQSVDGETPDEFADNGGYDYAGIYVWYFIRKYGFERFLDAYRNTVRTCEILPDGFEREAVAAYQREYAVTLKA